MSTERTTYRTSVYEYLKSEGLEITPERHDKIKSLLIGYSELENKIFKNELKNYEAFCVKRRIDTNKLKQKPRPTSYLPD